MVATGKNRPLCDPGPELRLSMYRRVIEKKGDDNRMAKKMHKKKWSDAPETREQSTLNNRKKNTDGIYHIYETTKLRLILANVNRTSVNFPPCSKRKDVSRVSTRCVILYL